MDKKERNNLINEKVQQHYKKACLMGNEVFGVFLQGSQNYNPQGDVCVAYHRDRGEELRQARPIKLDKAAHEVYWAEFMYVYMQDGTWYFADLCSDNPILIPLTKNYTEYEDEDE